MIDWTDSVTIKVTQTNNRYVVEVKDNGDYSRLHILNEKSLKWNLKNVFHIDSTIIKECIKACGLGQSYTMHPYMNSEVA